MKNITAKQESPSNWREEMNEAKIDDKKYGKGDKDKDKPYARRHSYLEKNPDNVRSDRNKRFNASDVAFHGHSKVERERKQEHYKNRGVKTKGKKVNEDVYSTVKKVLDAGSKFVETNPVGKALGNVVKPFNSTDGGSNRKSATKKSQQEIIDKNLKTEELDAYNKVMYDEKGKKVDPNSDEWYKFPVYDKNGKLIKKDSPTEAAKTVNAEGKSYGITKGDGMSFPERLKKKKNDKKADKDYDGDGKVESSKDEYFGSKDKAIKKAMGEEIEGGVSVETYTKDTKFMEIQTLDVITAEPLRSDWRSDLKEVAVDKKITTTKGEFGKPGFSMNVRQMSGKELSDKLPTIGGVKLEMDQDGNLPNLGQFVSDTARTQANKFADSGIIDNNQTVAKAMGAKAGLDKPMTGDDFKQLAKDGTKDLAFNINKEIPGTTANRFQGVADNINKSTSNLKGKLNTSSGATTAPLNNSYSWRDQLFLGERLGGKGYKARIDSRGVKVSGDWEDSDRGEGNKAKKRAGGKVEKKSPTYKAYIKNK